MFWNKDFRKITNLTRNSLKMSFFLGHFESSKSLKKVAKTNSQGIIFVRISCQRVCRCTSWAGVYIAGISQNLPLCFLPPFVLLSTMVTRWIVKTSGFTRAVCKPWFFVQFKGFLLEFWENRRSSENRNNPQKITRKVEFSENRQKSGVFWTSPFTMHLVCTVKFFAYSPSRPLWDTLSHCKYR